MCGKRTDGSNGPARAPTLCLEHFTQKRHDERRWTREACLEGIRLHVERYGMQPISHDWLSGFKDAEMPDVRTIQREFGSWSAAMHAAGFESHQGIKPRSTRRNGVATYKIIEQNGNGNTWREVGEGEGHAQADALRAFLKDQPAGTVGRFVVVPVSSWQPRRVKLVMQPSLITIPD